MKDEWIKVGFIANTHGIRGEVKVQALSGMPERLLALKEAWIGKEKQPVSVQTAKEHKGMVLLSFQGIDDINQVLPWKGDYLYLPEENLEALPEEGWYHFQLIGLRAADIENGRTIGTVDDVLETFANDVLEIRTEDQKTILVPFVEAFIGEVDLEAKTILIRLIEGME